MAKCNDVTRDGSYCSNEGIVAAIKLNMQSRHATTFCAGRNINEAGTLIHEACTLNRRDILNGGNCMPSDPDPADMVRYCLNRAADCRRGAERATDVARKESWLEMEGLWFFLARSYDNQRRDSACMRPGKK